MILFILSFEVHLKHNYATPNFHQNYRKALEVSKQKFTCENSQMKTPELGFVLWATMRCVA